MTLPTHLNEACLNKALEKVCDTKNVKLENYEFQFANMNGGNFCSNIYRIKGNYKILSSEELKNKNFNFIIKDMIMDIAEIGTNELIMYEKILPEMFKILNETNTETINSKIAAMCFYAVSNKDYEFYIFEDLNTLDYKLANRCNGLNEKQAKLVLEKLAKFHATSMVYKERFPETIATLNPAHFAEGAADPIAKNITKNGMKCALEIFQNFDHELALKIEKLALEFNEKIKKIINPNESLFNVLNHGDLWINNMLFQTEDVVFLDFQNSFWGSPAYDLNYFLYTSLSLTTLQTQRFQLLHHYYKILKSTLEFLKFQKIPTFYDLLKEIRRCALIGYYATLCEMPICFMNDEIAKHFTVETFHNSELMRNLIFNNSKVYKFIWHAVLHFQEIGLLDE